MHNRFRRSLLGFDPKSVNSYHEQLVGRFNLLLENITKESEQGDNLEQGWIDTKSLLSARPFKPAWFGWNKRSVMQYYRQLVRLQGSQLDELRDKLMRVSEGQVTVGKQIEVIEAEPEASAIEKVERSEAEPEVSAVEKVERIEAELDESAAKAASNVLTFPMRTVQDELVRAAKLVNHNQDSGPGQLRNMAVGSGFWDDADDYLNRALGASIPELSVAAKQSAPSKESYAPSRTRQIPREEPQFEEDGQSGQGATEPNTLETSPGAHASGSSAVTEEIVHLRRRYIVGKIAGEDLYDRSGRLIIAKGQPITESVMENADSAGKLAELIVNMMIKGLGD